jgi:hypothetical protein
MVMSDASVKAYRIATDAEKTDYCSDDYDLLVGPDGFQCFLGEPEDRAWNRDGAEVVRELNRLHRRVVELEAELVSERTPPYIHIGLGATP